MTKWLDLVHPVPQADELIYIRRYPEDTPVLYGTFHPSSGQALCGPANWPLPWFVVTHWREFFGTVPTWPPPSMGGRAWRDIFWQPPADNQFGWVRRFDTDCTSIMASFSRSSLSFTFSDPPLQLPWWAVWKWRPA
jgi:hypothetical protein